MKIIYGVIAFIVLVIIAAFVVPGFMDWNSYKPEILEPVEALTGRQLSIDGDIEISLLPSPKLRVSDVRLSNVEGANAADMMRLQALDLQLALGPLLSGDFQVSSLELIDPVIELERLADGRQNWRFTPGDGTAAEADGGASDEDGEEDATEISGDVSIRNGTIIYRDSASGTVEYIQRLNGTLSAKSLEGPFRGDGSMAMRGLETAFQIASGRKRGDGQIPVSFKVELGEGMAQLGFEGMLFARQAGSEGSGTLRASGPDLADLLAQLGIGGAQSLAAEKFSLKASAEISETSLNLDELQIRLGETRASGAIAYVMGSPAQLDAALTINRFDLDRIAENGAPASGAESASQTSQAEATAPGGEDGAMAATGIGTYMAMLPDDLAASVDLEVQTLRYLGGVVHQAHAILSLDEGVITVQQASALLPGGSNVALFGQLSPAEDGPRFDGQLEVESDDARAVISWLDMLNASDIPSDRLRRFSLTTAISADETGGELSELDLRIDASRLKGYANFSHGARNSLDANLHLDRLNADAYLAVGAAEAGVEAGVDAGADAGAAPPEAAEAAAQGGDLGFLDSLDAKLKLTAGRLSYGGAVLSGVTLEGVLKDNIITLHRLNVSDLSGAKLALNGEIRDLAGAPDVNLSFDAKADSILGLIRVAGIDPSFRADNLGAVSLAGSLSGGRDAVSLNARLETRPAVLSLVGSITSPLDDAALNLGLEMRSPDVAELMRAADMSPPKLVRRLGALALDGGLDGGLEALNLSLSARAAGNHLQVAGNLADFSGGGRYNLAFDLANPSFAALAELLSGAQYEGEEVGAVRIKGRLAGGAAAAAISDLSVALGTTRISGAADLELGGPVPVLRANLEAGLLDAGLFIGGAVAGDEEAGAANASRNGDGAAQSPGQQPQRPGERWSREPFDLSPLAEIEADISLLADAILAGGYRFDQAEFKFRVAGGALEIDSLRGRIFDGLLEAQGRIADAAPPQVNLAFKLDSMDLASALRQAADIEAVTGRASLDGRFASEGLSEYDLVRALRGDATLNARNGTVEGVDLRLLSDRLGDLNDPSDFLNLADTGLSGGTTRLESLDDTIHVKNGLATTSDLLLVADGGRGSVRGTADLPSWRLDLTALFDLTDHPKAPPLGVRMTGAIDNPARELLISDMQAYLIKRIAKTAVGKLVLPKLRDGAKAEPGSIEDTLLRGVFGDPDDGEPARSPDGAQPPPAEDSPPASIEDVLLRGVLGDSFEDAPSAVQPRIEESEPALAPQRGGSEPSGLAPQRDGAEPAGLAPQQGEISAERAPAPQPAPAPEPIPERADDDPLSPQDILKGVFDILND
ncbi:MAG: AsmA family protein [Alphaproteobacteria bacterium]|jgi:uncharacterized protein involved in outer membrane biogenesis|nr:AsmA family protein [Alphaproteobacteria bacterium]